MARQHPAPTDHEIELDPAKYIVSKTDDKGRITYANEYFTQVCGYSERELLGAPHSIIRHPDMPKAVFFLLWEHIQNGKNISAVVKNLTKNGDYYWVVTDFEIRYYPDSDEIYEYIAFRHFVPKKVRKEVEKLYARMLELEKADGMDASVAYLNAFLEKQGMDYNAFIDHLAKPKGLAAKLFGRMKKMFD